MSDLQANGGRLNAVFSIVCLPLNVEKETPALSAFSPCAVGLYLNMVYFNF
jgi:hypothetical protein